MVLKNVGIRSAKSRERAYTMSDGGGLDLQITPAGHLQITPAGRKLGDGINDSTARARLWRWGNIRWCITRERSDGALIAHLKISLRGTPGFRWLADTLACPAHPRNQKYDLFWQLLIRRPFTLCPMFRFTAWPARTLCGGDVSPSGHGKPCAGKTRARTFSRVHRSRRNQGAGPDMPTEIAYFLATSGQQQQSCEWGR